MTEGTDPPAGDATAAWAASGAMALTGHADGPPLAPAAAVVPALEDLAQRFAHLAADTLGVEVPVEIGPLLSGRAALLGLRRQGQVSANGSCRLLATADGWAAVNLARPSDVEAVGALVERAVEGDPWTALARAAERLTAHDLTARATLLGIPAAILPPSPSPAPPTAPPPRNSPTPTSTPDSVASAQPPNALPLPIDTPPAPPTAPLSLQVAAPQAPTPAEPSSALPLPVGSPPGSWTGSRSLTPGPACGLGGWLGAFTLRQVAPGRGEPLAAAGRRLVVVDLSAMWAGPLCAHLLGRAGLRVVKVESTRRPDGARAGDPRFFDWLHGGRESVALDLASAGGRAELAHLVAAADVVIESSRPRALAQLGIDAEAVIAARPGVTWVSITGHGRHGAAGHRVAFGDDAAAAAGLVARDDQGRPVFCGDAIADPITGLAAAVGALTSIATGGGHLVDVPMVAAAGAVLATPAPPAAARRSPTGEWLVDTPTGTHPVVPPRQLPPTPGPARPLGADTTAVLDDLAVTRG